MGRMRAIVSGELFPFCRVAISAGLALAGTACGDSARNAPRADVTPSVDLSAAGVTASPLDPAEAAATQAYINGFYSDSDIKHSFHTQFNERIDCIDFAAQRSVKSMVAQGLRVDVPDFSKLPPPPLPPDAPLPETSLQSAAFGGEPDQDGQPRKCPAGTVPTSRPTIEEIQAAGGLAAYTAALASARHPQQSNQQYDCYLQTTQPIAAPATNYGMWEHAAGYQQGTIGGATARMSVWDPYVQYATTYGEHSLGQLWVESGTCENWFNAGGSNQCSPSTWVQSIEVGWIVGQPWSVNSPSLFVFSTQDGYLNKNCWAGKGGSCCPGGSDCWVAAPNATMMAGMSLPTSVLGFTPYELAVTVWNGWNYGYPGWMVSVNQTLIGWYPAGPSLGSGQMFSGQMQESATYLQAGGEVFDAWANNQHTQTQMGSSFLNGYEYSAYQRQVGYYDTMSSWYNASLQYVVTPSGDRDLGKAGMCGYDAGYFYGLDKTSPPGGTRWGSYFYFGGN